ncbi:MAG: Wzz/FepE/Etk N-terminal domain-containing protein, partial [Acidobacteriota bacterium]|nr:Wzz/FepE/Etk N-terminal domain-containing protein [Acidobacteriota bacterium]
MSEAGNEASAKKAIVLEILDGLLRSWWTVVAGVCLGLTVAVIALHSLPKTYQARTVIYVAPTANSRDRAAVPDDMRVRIRTLRERVLSRQYLNSIIEEHYEIPATQREIEELHDSIASRVQADVRQSSFFLQYADSDPYRCAAV